MSANKTVTKTGGYQLLAARHTHRGIVYSRGDVVPLSKGQYERQPEGFFDTVVFKPGDEVPNLRPESKAHALEVQQKLAERLDPKSAEASKK